MTRELGIEGLIVQRLCNPSIELFAQPVVALNGNENTAAFEFLTRFNSYNNEIILPNQVFANPANKPFLEELDLEIFDESLKQLNSVKDKWRYNDNFIASINVSQESVKAGKRFLDKLDEIKKSYSEISRNNLSLEIDEKGDAGLSHFVSYAQKLGYSIAIDDIGTKNSSISKLRDSIISYTTDLSKLSVKIDQSFISNLLSPNNLEREIEEAFINLIMAFKKTYPDINVIAEGVENEKTAMYLRDNFGIEYGQGFFWRKPEKLTPEYSQPKMRLN